MTERPDPVDILLAQLRVPAVAPDLTARIVGEAQRPGRARIAPPTRPREWSRARRGTWTAVIAINIVLASAVAAAIGAGGRYLPAPVATVAHHIIERLRSLSPVHHRSEHPAARAQVRSPAARPLAPPARHTGGIETVHSVAVPTTIEPEPGFAGPPITAQPAAVVTARHWAQRRGEPERFDGVLSRAIRPRLVARDRAIHPHLTPSLGASPRPEPIPRDTPPPYRPHVGKDRGFTAPREMIDGGLGRSAAEHPTLAERDPEMRRDDPRWRDIPDGSGKGNAPSARAQTWRGRPDEDRREARARVLRDSSGWRGQGLDHDNRRFRGPGLRGGPRGRRFR